MPDLTGLVAVILWRLARVLEEIVLSAFLNFRWLINSVRSPLRKILDYVFRRNKYVLDAKIYPFLSILGHVQHS